MEMVNIMWGRFGSLLSFARVCMIDDDAWMMTDGAFYNGAGRRVGIGRSGIMQQPYVRVCALVWLHHGSHARMVLHAIEYVIECTHVRSEAAGKTYIRSNRPSIQYTMGKAILYL